MRRSCRWSCWSPLLLAACIGSNPPGPAPRFFDPTPVFVAAPAATGEAAGFDVTAAPYLGQPFAVRTHRRELAFDELHRWCALPDRLVHDALVDGLFASGRWRQVTGRPLAVHVLRFEIDLVDRPQAVVELSVATARGVRLCRGESPAAGREGEQLASAMSLALQAAVEELAKAP